MCITKYNLARIRDWCNVQGGRIFRRREGRSGEESAWQGSSTGMTRTRENAERRRKAAVSDRKEESVSIDRGS